MVIVQMWPQSGMAVAVSILVALVTACVKVGPPRAELAAWTEKGREMCYQVLISAKRHKNMNIFIYLPLVACNNQQWTSYAKLPNPAMIEVVTLYVNQVGHRNSTGKYQHWNGSVISSICICCVHRYTDLLHLGIEVGVAVCDYELDCFISYFFIRGFHGDAPDKIHPCQVKALNTLQSDDMTSWRRLLLYIHF